EYGQSLVPPLQLSPAVNHARKALVEKGPPTYVATACACLTARSVPAAWRAQRASKRSPNNLRITGAAPRRRSVLAPHYPRFRCGGSDRRLLLAGRHPLP